MNPNSERNLRSVLVLGANGRFGLAATQAFVDAGWRVLVQVRRTPDPAMASSVTALRLAPSETDALAGAATGVNVVVHGLNPSNYGHWDEEAPSLLQAGLAVAGRLDAHFMFPGNVYGWGTNLRIGTSEQTPLAPHTGHGRIRVQMERAVAEYGRSQRATIITAGEYFGGGRGNWIDQAIVASLAKGRLVYPGPLEAEHAWAYLPDFARAFVAMAQRATPGFERYQFAGYTLTGAQLLDSIDRSASRLGLAPARGFKRVGLPWMALRLAGLVVPRMKKAVEMSYLWRTPHSLDGERIRQAAPQLRITQLDHAMDQTLRRLFPQVTQGVRRLGVGISR